MTYNSFAKKSLYRQMGRGVFDEPRQANPVGLFITSVMVLLAASGVFLSVF